MQQQFKVLGISHKQAPVAVREALALNEQECRDLLHKLKEIGGVSEALVVSTCNRTELYYEAEADLSTTLFKLLALVKQQPNLPTQQEHFFHLNNTLDVVNHLYRVSMGLESSVAGDLQITNQVKKAYQYSADAQMAGPFIHRLLHSIFFTNKRVVQETAFRDGAASVSYAACEQLAEVAERMEAPQVLVLGVGEIGSDLTRHLAKHYSHYSVTICNRTDTKAQALALETGFTHIPFEQAHVALAQADVVVSSIAATTPFVTPEKLSGLKPLQYFIDLSVPRSIDPAVDALPGCTVYNIDDVRNRANQAVEKRLAAVPAVERIVAESVAEFQEWSRDTLVSPTIKKLKGALEKIRQEEIERHLKGMNEQEAAAVDKVTKGMMQKIIKLPVLQLKAACQRGEADTLIDILNDLFNLEAQPQNKEGA